MARFEGKLAVVTGAGQSIGLKTAKAFVDEGAKVILVGRTAAKIEAAAASLGENAIPYTMDIGVEADWLTLVEYIKSNFGEMDYLVNNAGIIPGKSIKEMDLDTFKEVERINLEGTFLGMKHCYEVLKKGTYSAIVNVSSVGSKRTGPNSANDVAYNATKAGINMLTKHAAYMYGPDCIRVNCVLPASVNTPMREEYFKTHPEALANTAKTKPIPPHCTEPEHIAAAILFCCDPSCCTMTGTEVLVDAGFMTI